MQDKYYSGEVITKIGKGTAQRVQAGMNMETILGTAVAAIIVIGCVVLSVRALLRDKKNGKSLCGGDCRNCKGHCR